jgi:uncharacterized membrane protein YphA (DoxX/SURF4 family)
MAPASRARLGKLLLVLGRLTLAGIFLFAAYGKLRPVDSAPFTAASLKITSSSLSVSMMLFAMQVDSYQILPPWAVMAVSHTLPWFELGIGLLLLGGIGLRWVSVLTTLLVAGFFGVIVRSYFAGMKINCGCFGPGAEPLSGLTILRDGLFLALALGVTAGAFLQARAKREARAIAAAQPAQTAAPADS